MLDDFPLESEEREVLADGFRSSLVVVLRNSAALGSVLYELLGSAARSVWTGASILRIVSDEDRRVAAG
jgi:hypothetical protein